jgi:hypothetical protein
VLRGLRQPSSSTAAQTPAPRSDFVEARFKQLFEQSRFNQGESKRKMTKYVVTRSTAIECMKLSYLNQLLERNFLTLTHTTTT